MYNKLQKYLIYFVLFLIILACSWALFRNDFFVFHDFTQGARIIEMALALKDGHFPVIWSANFGYGYGMPLFEFYAPLPYYFGAIFYLAGFSLINSVKAIIFLTSLVTVLGSYLLGKKLYGKTGGLIVSAAVTLAPYRAVNLFVRGAISEAWGIMTLPFILLGIVKTIKGEKNGWLLLVLSTVVLLLSHNLTALIFLPISVVFGGGYLFLEFRNKVYIKNKLNKIVSLLIGGYFLAVLLSAFYTIPAYLEKDFTRLETTVLSDYFDYHLHFVGISQFFEENWGYGGSTYGPMDGISFYLGFGQLVGLFLSGYVFLRYTIKVILNKHKSKFNKKIFLYLLLVVLFGFSLLMTTNKSIFIWQTIPILSFLQFPWRYLSAAIIFVGLLIGLMMKFLPNDYYRYGYATILIVILIVINAQYFQPEIFTSNLGDYYYEDTNKLRTKMSTTLPDYIPNQILQKEISPVALQGHTLYCQVLNNCELNFEIIENRVNTKLVKVVLEKDQQLIFSIANYPGWIARIDGKKVQIISSEQGYIQVFVLAGEHLIEVSFENTPIRRNANLISILGLVILLGIFFWYYKEK